MKKFTWDACLCLGIRGPEGLTMSRNKNRPSKRRSAKRRKGKSKICMNCVLKAVASGESPSLAEVFDLEQAKDFLLFCYYFFFIKTCTGAPFEWGPVISEWVQTFGKDQA